MKWSDLRKELRHTYRNDQRYRKRSVDGNILSNQKIEERKKRRSVKNVFFQE